MTDTFSPIERSRIMSRISSKNTAPEIKVRCLLHKMGYRYRLHRSSLPGKPDIVFPSRQKVIFVNGCFWHGHKCSKGKKRPHTNADYWNGKIDRTKVRDKQNKVKLKKLGWKALTVWECQIKYVQKLSANLNDFLQDKSKKA